MVFKIFAYSELINIIPIFFKFENYLIITTYNKNEILNRK